MIHPFMMGLVYPEALEENHERPALRQAQGERIGGTHFKGARPLGRGTITILGLSYLILLNPDC